MRPNGFYWVQCYGEWIVAECYEGEWSDTKHWEGSSPEYTEIGPRVELPPQLHTAAELESKMWYQALKPKAQKEVYDYCARQDAHKRSLVELEKRLCSESQAPNSTSQTMGY